ncbi:hypothetical protein E4T44_02220 [Aureobasidium sp. EXF-8845]|nr:hypothetical protein E4T44_02220 [Aureobasidium sp. EXF-8845]KAI4856317.1 hypothetical protein E4T45_02222 [Aureobasidium sp. EXF-8846]
MPVWISHDLTDDVTCTELTPRQPTDEHSWQQGSMNRQSALLRFRYQVVPWIESNNCKSIFGPAIMTLARDSRIISDCISASVQTKSDNLDVGSTTSVGLSMSPRLLDRLACEDTLTADIGFALLTISSVFYTPPSEWAVIVSTCETRLAESVILGGGFELTPEPLKSLLRLHLKVDLAASIVTDKPPSANSVIPSVDLMTSDLDDPLTTYDGCLSCLALSLRLIHFKLIPMLTGFHESSLEPVGSHVSRWDRWFDLWSRCMSWFQERPRKMKPVLESPDEEPRHNQSFPIDVFTSATSLQANLVMHISAVTLLSQKPRLTNATSSFQRLGSRSWHIQKIARMLVGNHFNEQWDPIVIAALLSIAKEMSHPSQQEALLSCFREISKTTQIPIETDVSNLCARWQLIQQDEPPTQSHSF